MSVTTISTACVWGAQVLPVRIEVDLQPGLPVFTIIGLPDKRIDEARERVRAALKNCGFSFPLGRLTINLAPSDLPKQGTGFDLAIALGILQASQKIPLLPDGVWVLGELSLDGLVRPIPLLLALLIEASRQSLKGCIIPALNQEAALIEGLPLLMVKSLPELLDRLRKRLVFTPSPAQELKEELPTSYLWDQMIGQSQAKRAAEIATAGNHPLLLSGPPGSGKTMLAKAAYQLLPPLSKAEALEVAQILAFSRDTIKTHSSKRPFRAPHSSISQSGLLGGGVSGQPGELSLAHRGLLFLDEFTQLRREVRESLRQPMQEAVVRLQRRGYHYVYPAHCFIIAAQNSCFCGLRGVEGQNCRCTPSELMKYQRIISQPLLDRFELFCELPKIKIEEWVGKAASSQESGQEVAERINQARLIQYRRFTAERTNDQMDEKEVRVFCRVNEKTKQLLRRAASQFYLSGRGIHSLLRVARTIADLAAEQHIGESHLQEALMYRQRNLTL